MSDAQRRVIVDVGANSGEFGLEAARRNPDALVVCIEPVPELAQGLREAAVREGLSGVHVVQDAIGPSSAEAATMHVAARGDWGTSSLLDFDRDAIAADEYWSLRPDLAMTGEVTVRVRTLAEVLGELSVGTVDFCKIDVQGLDLAVLGSAGERLASIRAGMLEVPVAPGLGLYAGEQQDLGTAYETLGRLGFDVIAVKPNDEATNEVNVFFARRGEDLAAIEAELSLRGMKIYDGKHFWVTPCSTMEEVAGARAQLAEAGALREEVARLAAEAAGATAREGGLAERLGTALEELGGALEARRRVEAELAEARAQESGLRHALVTALEREVQLREAKDEVLGAEPAADDVSRLEAEVATLRAQRDEILASTSWRVSAPVRRLGALVGRRSR